jgi:hypothetical protein
VARFKSIWAGISDLSTLVAVCQGLWWVLGIAGLSVVLEMVMAWMGASPLQGIGYALATANFLVLGLLLYRTFKLNVSIEFQPREHTAYFHQWGIVSEEESFQASYNNRSIISGWLVRIRLRVYSGDTVEGVKVTLTEVKECEELRGMLPFALLFKDDNTIPHKTCIDLHPDDDQFVDVASWKYNLNDGRPPTIIFHNAIHKDAEVPLKPYELTIKVTGKGIRSESMRFWIGISEYEDNKIGMRKDLFSMRLLQD